MFAHDVFTPRHYVMAICLTLSYFMARHYNIMTSSQVEGIQGTTLKSFPIESYFSQVQDFLYSTMNAISELWQSYGALEAHVTSMQLGTTTLDEYPVNHLLLLNQLRGPDKEENREAYA